VRLVGEVVVALNVAIEAPPVAVDAVVWYSVTVSLPARMNVAVQRPVAPNRGEASVVASNVQVMR